MAQEIRRQHEYQFPNAIQRLEASIALLNARKELYLQHAGTAKSGDSPPDQCGGIFYSADIYTKLVTEYLMEHAEEWPASKTYLCEYSVQNILRPVT